MNERKAKKPQNFTAEQKKAIDTVVKELKPQVEQGNKIQELRRELIKKGVVLTCG